MSLFGARQKGGGGPRAAAALRPNLGLVWGRAVGALEYGRCCAGGGMSVSLMMRGSVRPAGGGCDHKRDAYATVGDHACWGIWGGVGFLGLKTVFQSTLAVRIMRMARVITAPMAMVMPVRPSKKKEALKRTM